MFRMAVALLAHLVCADTGRASPWPPSPDHKQVSLWSGTPPHPLATTLYDKETLERGDKLIAGRPFLYVHSVTRPTLTIYRPRGRNTGAGVLVFPGGGFCDLAIDFEGTEVCDWLTANGITCILVKYRVPDFDKKDSSRTGLYPKSPVALEDAQRAILLTRFHAADWGLDGNRIGMIGFSVGGQLVAATSTHDRIYARTDAADDLSARPNFVIALYPGHLPTSVDKLELNTDISVDARTPPQLIIQRGDDPVDSPNNALAYYVALHRAMVPAELHLYPDGGHAFSLRRTVKAIIEWPTVALRWLKTIGVADLASAALGKPGGQRQLEPSRSSRSSCRASCWMPLRPPPCLIPRPAGFSMPF